MYKIILADDHQVVRNGIKATLELESNLSIVAEASNGLEAIKLVDDLQPDVLIVDLMMPYLHGLEVIRQVRKCSPSTRVVVLSVDASLAGVIVALRNGASGYVQKDSSASYLAEAVCEVLAGRRYLSPPLSMEKVENYAQKCATESLDPYSALTARERQVFQLTSEGSSSKQIGEKLLISPRTAETHRANIMRKLEIKNHSELIRLALVRGILPIEAHQSNR